MPNWCEGTLKVRGTRENLLKWMQEGFDKSPEATITEDGCMIELEKPYNSMSIAGMRRCFADLSGKEFYLRPDRHNPAVGIILIPVSAAWYIAAEELAAISAQYNIDFKIWAFEEGMEFNLDIEVVGGKIIKDEDVKFDNYFWDCIKPEIGG